MTEAMLRRVFIERTGSTGSGLRVAVKDCIDVAGLPTTAGCRVIAATARSAQQDAECLAGARRAGARIVGKTTLSELCHGGLGVNQHFGTPINPLDPMRVPGGSSSGSAVAVAVGEADVAYGTDTLGSVRIPAAACGVVGMIPTRGRVSTAGVFPLAPSLDTVGVLARDADSVARGLALLLGHDSRPGEIPELVLRIRVIEDIRPEIDQGVDRLLAAGGIAVRELALPGWSTAVAMAKRVELAEAFRCQRQVLEFRELLTARVLENLAAGSDIPDAELTELQHEMRRWRDTLLRLIPEGAVLAMPTLFDFPPRLNEDKPMLHYNGPVNAAGLPAVSLPVGGSACFASLQLIGRPDTETSLLTAARHFEQASA